MVQFKQPSDIIAILLFFCVCFSSFFPVGQTGFSIFHVISFSILSAENKLHLTKKSLFFFFFFFFGGEGGVSQKIRRGEKNHLFLLCLCRSRQILGYVCRPIKGSQLTPYCQVRLTCLPSNIHVFLFKQISCLLSVVCEYIPSYYGFFSLRVI